MIEETIPEKLSYAGKTAYKKGIQYGSGGNMSAYDGEYIYVTPSGKSVGQCNPDAFVKFSLDDDPMELDPRPSRDTLTHQRIYKSFADIRSIMHLHPPYATIYAVLQEEIPLYTLHGKRILGRIPILPVLPEGSVEFEEAVVEFLENNKGTKVLLLAEHGIMGFGKDPVDAENSIELAEECAQLAWRLHMMPDKIIKIDENK